MSKRAAELRAVFDGGFADALPPPVGELVGLVLLSIGETRYALPLARIAAIHAAPRIGTVPSKQRAFLGLATVRNTILPVFDLSVALGHRKQPLPGRWIVIGKGDVAVAWAFDALDGHLRIELPPGGSIGSSVDIAGITRRVIDLEELRHGQ